MRSIRLLLVLLTTASSVCAQEDLNVISGQSGWMHYTDASNALYHHFASEAYSLLESRKKSLNSLRSADDWKARQAEIRKTLNEIVGPFPAKTPLNAKVVRTLEKDSYRVEHIVYESQPGFYVTSSLFIPKSLRRGRKAPTIIYCSGHAAEGYRSRVYQNVMLNLVKKGFIVFAFDPVGQGERFEYYDTEKRTPSVGGPTTQHSYPGSQAFVSGSSQAKYMIWDGIRAVDYLLTRKEVDPARIGITGRSGGGTQSSYIAAFDDRIAAAAPECYITGFSRLLQSIGPQDAEQNFFNGIARGIDHGDLLIVRAPKPTLMITTTRDFFSIQGARETAEEVKRVYEALGTSDNFGMVEDDAPHASTKKNREAMYAFFQKHLNNPGDNRDEELPLLTEEEIKVTKSGQVITEFNGETVFSLNAKFTDQLIGKINQQESRKQLPTIVSNARTLSGYRDPDHLADAVFTGRVQQDGYAIEKYFVSGEGNYVVPFLVVVPQNPSGKVILYLHPSSKAAEANPDGEIAKLAENGFTVIAPDLPGVGELGPGAFKGDAFIGGISHNTWYSAMLVGRSISGVQASDIVRVISSLAQFKNTGVFAIARGEMAPALLHAAAFSSSIRGVALINPLSSYRQLVKTQLYHSSYITGAVPGMLKAYDLPELAATIAPRDMLIVNPRDGSAQPLGQHREKEEYEFTMNSYRTSNPEGLKIMHDTSDDAILQTIIKQWK